MTSYKKDEAIKQLEEQEKVQKAAYDKFITQKEELKKDFAADYDNLLNDGLLKKIEKAPGVFEQILRTENMALSAYYFGKFGTLTPTPAQISSLNQVVNIGDDSSSKKGIPPQPLKASGENLKPTYIDLDNFDLDD